MCLAGCSSRAPQPKSKTICGSTTTSCPYASGIIIKGSSEFRKTVEQKLGLIEKTATGKKLFKSIKDSGKKVTIVERTTKGNAAGYSDPSDRFKNTDGTLGDGTDSTVYFNPSRTQIGDGTEDWMVRPTEVGLGHELIHAEQAANGKQVKGKTDGTNNRELQAVGLPPYDKDPISENKLRSDLGEPKRTYY